MLLQPLVSKIETIKERIATHGAVLRQNETRTRMALIDPLLQALGWDTSDPGLVLPEYQTGGKADYALLNREEKPVAIIEAKHLGEPLARHQQQMFTYAVMEVIQYAGLTDGDNWEFYKVFADSPSERLLLRLSIADDRPHDCALNLLLLWRFNLESGQPTAANRPLAVQPTESVVDPPPPEVVAINAPKMFSASPGTETNSLGTWSPIRAVTAGTGNKSPASIRFFGRDERSIRNWRSILVESADWLVRNGHLTASHCPINEGSGWLFINSTPYKPNGRDFFSPREISGGIFLETNLSASDCIRFSRQLLSRFRIDLDSVELLFE